MRKIRELSPEWESRISARKRSQPDPSRPPSSSSSAMHMPAMLDTFDAMPPEMQTYMMYQLLRRCSKKTLSFMADVINPALKCDIIGMLPPELTQHVISYLDVSSLCKAAQVSKYWRHVVNSDEKTWKNLLDRDGYSITDAELCCAIKEGWGWQDPSGPEGHERDISSPPMVKSDSESSTISTLSSTTKTSGISTATTATTATDSSFNTLQSSRSKRKAPSTFSGRKQQKRKAYSKYSPNRFESDGWLREFTASQGPYVASNAAALAVPAAQEGLPSLRQLHLYKSLYRRQFILRHTWMKDSKPRHIAFRAHQGNVVTCLQFDFDKILTGSDDTNINIYDTKTGALRSRLEGHEGGVWALQYEGNILVSGSTDRTVRVWDIERAICTQVFHGHTSTVRCLQILMPAITGYSKDGKAIYMPKQPLIIAGSRDSSLRVWKLPREGDKNYIQVGPPPMDVDCPYFVRTLAGHTHSVRAIAAHGDTLVSGSYDTTVRVWKISTGETTFRLDGHHQKVYSVVLDHVRNRCISGSMDNMVKIWSLDSGAVLYNLEGHTSLVGLLDLSHNRLVSAAADATLRIWDPETGQCKSTLTAHTGAITCFQHDDQKVISGSDRMLKMWNVKTGECIKDLLTDLSGVWQVRFNSRLVVTAVQRGDYTYIEVLDFGASRDGIPEENRGRRILVNSKGVEIPDPITETNTANTADTASAISV